MPSSIEEGGGLQFGPPQQWNPEWTRRLARAGRFQEITIKPLNDRGAQHFCWIKPGELIAGDDTGAVKVPHGGFVYLFHKDPMGGSKDEVLLDRYFAVCSEDEYRSKVAAAGHLAQTRESFVLVSQSSGLVPPSRGSNMVDNSMSVSSIPTPPATHNNIPDPGHWSSADGLVVLESKAHGASFQSLLDKSRKHVDNWTRDRGCSLHGVSNCPVKCMVAHKQRVPKG